jgi:hypothetical protein
MTIVSKVHHARERVVNRAAGCTPLNLNMPKRAVLKSGILYLAVASETALQRASELTTSETLTRRITSYIRITVASSAFG